MKLSIVATLYKSAPYINEFCERSSAAARQLVGEDYEIVLVNDGSPDDSLQIAIDLYKNDPHIMIVDLSKNFGHHKAIMAGLEHAEGEKIFLIDSDLEEEPEWLLKFSKLMKENDADVVFGVQESRKGGWFERWSGYVFYSVFNWLANIEHPRNIVTTRLMTRRYVEALLKHQEREIVISCLWVITGYKQCEVFVKKHGASKSTYNLSKKFQHAINSITSFSDYPLRMIFYIGFIIFMASLLYAATLVFNKVFFLDPVAGWTSVMVSVWILGGMVISFLGVIGIYLSKIFIETKRRPNFIVRRVYGRD